jgi:hypothetical protein
MSSQPPPQLWFDNNTMIVELLNLKNDTTGLPITDATVTAVLYTEDGDPVPDAAFSLAHAGGGTYRAMAADTIDVVVGQMYRCTYAASVSGARAEWSLGVIGARR